MVKKWIPKVGEAFIQKEDHSSRDEPNVYVRIELSGHFNSDFCTVEGRIFVYDTNRNKVCWWADEESVGEMLPVTGSILLNR